MSACCVPGCKNRHSSTSKLKFYRIPSGYRPFQANRRRLWLQAIKQVNGSTEEVKGNARICGAHFISGEASLDHDSPDFVPSVFTCTKPKPSPKKKVKRLYRRRRRRRRKVTVETRGKTAPPEDDTSVDLQSSVLMETESKFSETIQTLSDPSVPKEGEPLSKETEATSSPKKPTLLVSADILKLDRISPVVLLKPIVAPAGGFQCELCCQNFVSVLELVKHKQKHDEEKKSFMCEICGKHFTSQADFTEHQHVHADEPSFPCNMCDRSFTTSHNLKRHKLLHVKDGRKCPTCGVLFCRRHNHILFLPKTDSVSESEQDFTIIESQNDDSNVVSKKLEKRFSPKPEPKTSLEEKCSLSEIPVPLLQKTSTVPCPHPPVPCYSWSSGGSSKFKAPLCSPRAAFIQPPPPQFLELPASLQIFSPQYLTSALLEVKRNYEYIINKPEKVKKELVKEEEVELPLISPDEQSVEQVKKERIAYDLEIML